MAANTKIRIILYKNGSYSRATIFSFDPNMDLGGFLREAETRLKIKAVEAVIFPNGHAIASPSDLMAGDEVVVLKAHETFVSPPQQASQIEGQRQIESNSTPKEDMPKSNSRDLETPLDIDGFMFFRRILFSRHDIWVASKDNGFFLLKVADVYNQKENVEYLKQEGEIYDQLKQLQGKYLARLAFKGILCGILYGLAFDLIDGADLADSGPFSVGEYSKIQKKASLALEKIHSFGILHGDIRPENILIWKKESGNHEVLFIDFEFAKRSTTPKDFEKEKKNLENMFTQMKEGLTTTIQD